MTISDFASVPAPAMPGLETMMDAAWLAPEREESDGWVLRAASGVTQRANSVWLREPDRDTGRQHEALRAARLWYRRRRLPLIFQVFDDPRSAGLNTVLDREGFTRQSETLVMCRRNGANGADQPAARPGGTHSAGSHPAVADPGVEISTDASEEWLELWWSVDGRGGPAERETAHSILAGCPSVYALVRSDDGVPAAVGRLAVPDAEATGGWGGLYCMATRPDARRRGHALRIMRALLHEGAARNVAGYWLLVTVANSGAQQLYAKAGFRETGRYLYRQERPTRHLTGC
ncbi:GNAT family N-acetyltransferase [Pseudarthrobacter sp. AL07]|uniref:GNAT family N-acetyltransferase n=1 Tax=unclassified Pseudarthrobacter TaxID=2647000 RepID=UPI00249B8B83|nr:MULTISPECIES: GNAT family N-acetyltransferase [unclassified Pseudarthrobacter]MDI3194965.1 GNAT family N-acetyltransferase [Pseudarthrobacter sp. AL20]MDI3208978.1 GNAT family N-acetyltransferase [Pseudarthrobacter sp. AL07]